MSGWLGVGRRRRWVPPSADEEQPPEKREPAMVRRAKGERRGQRVIRIPGELPVVIFDPLRCPECGGRELRTHTVRRPKRQHVCKSCGAKFKSIEEDVGEPT